MKKIIVIGINHAGTHAITTLLENNSNDIVVNAYDANDNISFLGCGTALWVSGVAKDPNALFYASKESLEQLGANIFMKHKVIDIDFDTKKVYVLNLITNKRIEDSYDDLIIAVGSWPINLKIPGTNLENVMHMKLFQDAQKIKQVAQDESIKEVAIVGAGYIGVELAESFVHAGKNVTLICDCDPLTNYYDKDFRWQMIENLKNHGIKVVVGEKVTEFIGETKVEKMVTDLNEYAIDFAITCVGFKPNTKWLREKNIALAPNKAIIVNNRQQTSIPHVYAIGDCATIYNNSTHDDASIMLATNAVRTGVVAAHNILGNKIKMQGVQGSNAIKIFDLGMFSTGITEELAIKNGFNVDSVTVTELIKPEFMPENDEVTLKVVWDKDTLEIIGSQMYSKADVSLANHFFSLAIEQKYPITKLALCDLFFLPHYNPPKNFITVAGLEALKKL